MPICCAERLTEEGIDHSLIATNPSKPSASYTAIEDRDGSLFAAIADMSIYDSYSLDQATRLLDALSEPIRIIADTNLPAEILTHLAANKGEHSLAVCAVSGPKANRAISCLKDIDLLFCNEAEAAILGDEYADLAALPEILQEEGVKSGVITKGSAGITAWQDGQIWSVPAPPVKIKSSNGAGDCLTGCVLHALQSDKGFQEALAYGMAGASLALMSEQAVPDMLNRTILEACLADIPQS